MKVAVVNIFDPLPGEAQREGRYGAFCRALAGAGHEVRWYSSGFSHAFKAPRDREAIASAAERLGYAVVLVPGRAYRENVSLGRLRSHRRTAAELERYWGADAWTPDAILVSLPPPRVGARAARWADRAGARLVVDVQDLWPETFRRFWPSGFEWLNSVAFAGMIGRVRSVYRRADVLIGAARGYVDHALTVASGKPAAVLPLGVDLEAFDAAVRDLGTLGLRKPDGERWLFLGGTVSAYVNTTLALDLMAALRARGREDVRLVVVGSGPDEPRMRAEAERRGLEAVRFMGQQTYETFASVAAASDVGLIPVRPESLVFFPNRAFDYFAAGLPVVSTIGGELAEVLARQGAGESVPPEPPAMADEVERLLCARDQAPVDHRRRRGSWVKAYDRPAIAAGLVRIIEEGRGPHAPDG